MSEMVAASQAAELLGVDKRSVLRLARAGKIRSFRTPGGQHRFHRKDIERLAAGEGNNRDPRPSASAVESKRDEVETLNLDVQARRAKRELARIEAEDEAGERERAETRRAEALAHKRALAEIRAKQEREREEREAARARENREREAVLAREAAERERHMWETKTISEALATLPRDVSPEGKAAASEALREALASLSPGEPRQLIEIAVSGAIAKALAPWRRAKEIEQAVEEAESSLPSQVPSNWSPTDFQFRYRAAADAAIRGLAADAPISQVRAAAHGEARRLAAELERGQAEERHRRSCSALVQSWTTYWGTLEADRDAAREAVANALARLPASSSQTELQKAADRALAPFLRRKEMTERAEEHLEHVRRYIEQLGAPDGEWDLGDYFERSKLVQQLKKKIRLPLIEALLAGEIEDQADAEGFIEDEVDGELED